MHKTLRLYHGARNIVGRPSAVTGSRYRDFGKGFYCTRDASIAAEWVCPNPLGGYVNSFDLDTKGLKVLDLGRTSYPLMYWLSVVTNNRRFAGSDFVSRAVRFLSSAYPIEQGRYDVIIGMRCDDSYYSFVHDFLSNTVPYRRFSSAMDLGREGEQIVITSEKGISALRYIGSEPVDPSESFRRRCERDIRARNDYLARGKASVVDEYDIMMDDLITGRIAQDDPRLQ